MATTLMRSDARSNWDHFLGAVLFKDDNKDAICAPRALLLHAAMEASSASFHASLEEATSEYFLGNIGSALPRDFFPKQKPPPPLGSLEAEEALMGTLWRPAGDPYGEIGVHASVSCPSLWAMNLCRMSEPPSNTMRLF